jgi:hypothetical protein
MPFQLLTKADAAYLHEQFRQEGGGLWRREEAQELIETEKDPEQPPAKKMVRLRVSANPRSNMP